jgi:hypothetical protein
MAHLTLPLHASPTHTGAANSPLCNSLLLSIANHRVFHNALHTGFDSNKEFRLHTFPKSILQQLEEAPDTIWPVSFRLPISASAASSASVLGAFPINPTIMFGAHRPSVFGNTAAAKTAAFTAVGKDQVRKPHARELTESRSERVDPGFLKKNSKTTRTFWAALR